MKRLMVTYIGLLLTCVLLTISGCHAAAAYALYEHGNAESEQAALLADYRKCVEAGAPDCQRFAPDNVNVHVVATDTPPLK